MGQLNGDFQLDPLGGLDQRTLALKNGAPSHSVPLLFFGSPLFRQLKPKRLDILTKYSSLYKILKNQPLQFNISRDKQAPPPLSFGKRPGSLRINIFLDKTENILLRGKVHKFNLKVLIEVFAGYPTPPCIQVMSTRKRGFKNILSSILQSIKFRYSGFYIKGTWSTFVLSIYP